MEEKLQVFIMPGFDSVRESLGYEEYDDYNVDSILFKQGYDGVHQVIKDEEIFEIPEDHIGRISSESEFYLLTSEEDRGEKEFYVIEDDLNAGRYKLSLKDHVIYSLEVGDNEDDEDKYTFGQLVGEQDDNDPRIERIFNLITDSAKKRFDYYSFSEKIGDETADSLLFQIMVSLAVGESKELIAAKIFAQIVMMSFAMENDSLVRFIKQREKDLAMEILALKMANTNLDNNANPITVYLQTEEFLATM